jgi:hypothetical protein
MEEEVTIPQGNSKQEALDPVRIETVKTAAVMLSMGWSVEIQTTDLYCALVVKNAKDDEELFLEINHGRSANVESPIRGSN